jgi:hypothetical protein
MGMLYYANQGRVFDAQLVKPRKAGVQLGQGYMLNDIFELIKEQVLGISARLASPALGPLMNPSLYADARN